MHSTRRHLNVLNVLVLLDLLEYCVRCTLRAGAEVLMRSLSSQCHASRIKKYSAYGARHQREDLSAAYAPRQHPATIVENAKALVLGTRQTRQHSETIDRTRR